MYCRTYGLCKTWFDKYLKRSVSEDPSKSRMVNGRKHCSELNDSTFTIFIDLCEDNSGWKNLSKLYAKSLGVFVNQLTADDKYFLLNADNF